MEDLSNSDPLGVNSVPFGGDFHVTCVSKTQIKPDTILGTIDSNNEIENCKYYSLVLYRKYKEETENRIGLGCVRCNKGFTGPVYNNSELQYLLGKDGEEGFLRDCSVSIDDFDSTQSTSYIGNYPIQINSKRCQPRNISSFEIFIGI
jgi:hypothetical protein